MILKIGSIEHETQRRVPPFIEILHDKQNASVLEALGYRREPPAWGGVAREIQEEARRALSTENEQF